MIEESINLWSGAADARCITTNGFVKRNGCAVMGAGCAKEAALMDPELPRILGNYLKSHGNVVTVIRCREGRSPLLSFPVKHHWSEPADPELIVRSAHGVIEGADTWGWERVLIPRPGCGNGRLRWKDIRPLLDDLLDDRFVIVHVPAKQRAPALP